VPRYGISVGNLTAVGEDEREEVRLFYAVASQRLVIGASGSGKLAARLQGNKTKADSSLDVPPIRNLTSIRTSIS